MAINPEVETQPTARTLGTSPKLVAATLAGIVAPALATAVGLPGDLVGNLLTTVFTALLVAVAAYFASPGTVVVESPQGHPILKEEGGTTDLAMADPQVRAQVGNPSDLDAK